MTKPDDVPEWAWAAAAALRSAVIWQSNASNEFIAHALMAAERRGIEAGRERFARVCEEQATAFLSPDYATGQPLASFSERFACGECAAAIRKLGASE